MSAANCKAARRKLIQRYRGRRAAALGNKTVVNFDRSYGTGKKAGGKKK